MAEALEQDHRCSESKFAASFVPLELGREHRWITGRWERARWDLVTG